MYFRYVHLPTEDITRRKINKTKPRLSAPSMFLVHICKQQTPLSGFVNVSNYGNWLGYERSDWLASETDVTFFQPLAAKWLQVIREEIRENWRYCNRANRKWGYFIGRKQQRLSLNKAQRCRKRIPFIPRVWRSERTQDAAWFTFQAQPNEASKQSWFSYLQNEAFVKFQVPAARQCFFEKLNFKTFVIFQKPSLAEIFSEWIALGLKRFSWRRIHKQNFKPLRPERNCGFLSILKRTRLF